MKKRILLLLAAMLCACLCACGGSTSVNGNNVLTEREGVVCIKRDKFSEILEKVELTTENWKDYIKFYSYDEEIVHKDEFGEITSSEIVTHYCLGAGNERYHQFQETVLELKNKETGELTIYNFDHENTYDVSEDFNLDNYECTRIKGRLYFVDIPIEALHSPLPELYYDWGYDTGFYLVTQHETTPYEVNAETKGIYKNGGNSWDEFFE